MTPKLTWNEHICSIVKKANSTRGFLQRNLRSAPAKVKEQAYKAFVRPTVEYAASVWDPPTQVLINKLEMVQRRAARFVLNDWRRTSSVTAMLQQLNWITLQQRRANAKLAMMFRICHGDVVIPFSPPYCIPIQNLRTRGHDMRLQMPQSRINVYRSSYFVSIVPLWNGLPNEAVHLRTVDAFRGWLSANRTTAL